LANLIPTDTYRKSAGEFFPSLAVSKEKRKKKKRFVLSTDL